MSKKGQKKIKELERNSRILSDKVRTLQINLELLFKDVKQEQARADIAISQRFEVLNMHFDKFRAGTIPSEKQQEKPTDYGANRCGIFCHHELPKTEQPQQSEAEKEQESPKFSTPEMKMIEREAMAELNTELAKFASLEAFNADRINKFLPPVGKLEFHKMKAAIECTIAIAKMVRPDYFDQIDQIKIPKEGQEKPEQSQPENLRENLGEPVLNKPNENRINRINCINAALKLLVDDLAKHLNFTLENYGKDRAKQVEMLQAYCDHFKQDLCDFRRKVLSSSELGWAKKDEPKQDSPTLSELEQDKVWIIQTNPHKVKRLNAFYLEKVNADGLVIHTPNPSEAMQFSTAMEAQIKAANIISCAGGRYKADDFKIVQADAKQPENEAKQVETEPDKWCIYNKANNSLVLIADEKHCQYNSKEEAEDGIHRLHNCGLISGKLEQYDTVLVSEILKRIEQKQAEESEPILLAPEQKEADKSGSELGGIDGADSPKEVESWVIEIRKKATHEKVGYVWKGSEKTMIVWQNLCDAKRFRSKQSAIDFFSEKFVMTDVVLFHTIVKI